jgi:2-keto-4-pentenoate hydratase/2-oxohepta-3-ene-1,7-dioic acid hydratase in catechol pathway
MKLIRFGNPGNESPGLLLPGGSAVDASGFGQDYDERFFGSDGLRRLSSWAEQNAATAPRVGTGVRLGPAIARPSKIVCIGLNYRDHALETNAQLPDEPIVFCKATSAWSGPNDDLVIPKNSKKTDWEVELAVVIGRRASHVSEGEALDYVAGYGVHNDYSEREFQLEHGGQWVKGKSADTFAPFGPYLATKDELADVHALDLWLSVNGERRQNSNTKNLIFGVPFLVSYLSRFMTLLPGDMISTGTPGGVGMGSKPQVFLRPGDVCTLSVAGLGQQEQKAVAHPGNA